MAASFFDRDLDFSDASEREQCFRFFDKDDKQYLSEDDFKNLVHTLFKIGEDDECDVRDLFTTFDHNKDQRIDAHEFETVWKNWIKPLVQPVTALLIIDVQNDFIDGTLALKNCPAKQDGKDVVPIINKLLEDIKFDVVAYSLDYHPEDHISFLDSIKNHRLSEDNEKSVAEFNLYDTAIFEGPPKLEQILWPKHCVQGSWGAKLHSDLRQMKDSVLIYKGTKSNVDSYSAFWDNMKLSTTKLHEKLQQRGVTHVLVCGLAYDYCVSYTALDALDYGYATVLILDAVKMIDLDNVESMMKKLESKDCVIANTTEVENITKGKDIRLRFAHSLKKKCQKIGSIL